MHHQDAMADKCQQYTQDHSRTSMRARLLQDITVMFCSSIFPSTMTHPAALHLVSL